jgi:hypothetical protein
MDDINQFNIDEETIYKAGLRRCNRTINAQISPDARIFEYPQLKDVFIMENDLYGNKMPKDSCFLAFNGQHGMIGKHLKVSTLRIASVEEIKNMVTLNNEG